MVRINPWRDTCPCDSKRLVIDCCFRRGKLFKPRGVTRPVRPRTGFAQAGCFGARLHDCSPGLTREHFISRSSLLDLVQHDGLLHVEGFPWQSNAVQAVSIKSRASKIACSRHNHALSPLDGAALSFNSALRSIEVPPTGPAARSDRCVGLVNGHDIERWCLKVLIGGLVSGNLVLESSRFKDWQPPLEWLEFLFGESASLRRGGLFVIDPVAQPGWRSSKLGMAPLFRDGHPKGLLLQIMGISFVFTVDPQSVAALDRGLFRPTEISIGTPHGRRIVAMSWERAGGARGVMLERQPPGLADAPQ